MLWIFVHQGEDLLSLLGVVQRVPRLLYSDFCPSRPSSPAGFSTRGEILTKRKSDELGAVGVLCRELGWVVQNEVDACFCP